MQLTRQTYQHGSLRKAERKGGSFAWEYRYRDTSDPKRPIRQITLSASECPTEASAWKAVEGLRMKLNSENPKKALADPSFGGLVDRFITDERLVFLSKQKKGQADGDGLQYATACAYLSILNLHIKPKWGTTPLSKMRPAQVQEWLLGHEAAPRYRSKIKSLMHRLFEKAMLWELIDIQRNPMSLVEIRGISKRRKKPVILTDAQYYSVLTHLGEPFRTMIVTAQCLGLRVSEILALKWQDIDFNDLTIRVVRKVVNGRVSRVKTEYSEDELPLDPAFAAELRRWQEQCPPSEGDWVFPNPASGNPYYASEIGKRHLRSAGEKANLEHRGQPIKLGWHTFRHTYRAWLDSTGTPVGVQQKLMRHANVSTTMDCYGNALMESKREANSKVVRMALKRAG